MSFGNAYVEGAVGHGIHQHVHRTSCRHGRRNAHNARILLGQFEQSLTEHILKLRRLRFFVLFDDALSAFDAEFSGSMPHGGLFFSRCKALAFYRMQVQEFGTVHIFDFAQNAYQFDDIVSVRRSEIADVHAFENILLIGQQRFHRIVEAQN